MIVTSNKGLDKLGKFFNEDPTLLYDLYNGSVVSSFNFCQIKEPYKISCHNLDGNV